MTNLELDSVEREMRSDQQYYAIVKRDRDPWLTRKLAVLLAIGAMIAIPMYADSVEFMCPHCEQDIELVISLPAYDRGHFFPDTWTCSQCGYENYVGINYCAMCGGK